MASENDPIDIADVCAAYRQLGLLPSRDGMYDNPRVPTRCSALAALWRVAHSPRLRNGDIFPENVTIVSWATAFFGINYVAGFVDGFHGHERDTSFGYPMDYAQGYMTGSCTWTVVKNLDPRSPTTNERD